MLLCLSSSIVTVIVSNNVLERLFLRFVYLCCVCLHKVHNEHVSAKLYAVEKNLKAANETKET